MANIGIAAVCMNREDNLIQSLPYWLESGAQCIHILDWNSEKNIENLVRKKFNYIDNVKFYRVDNGSPWILTHAFNIVLSSLQTDFIAKFDSDHICKKNIFEDLDLKKGSFYRFNFKDNEVGTNGAFISCVDILRKVNYFDERIVTYGWDESDLFDRVQEFCKVINFIDSSYISHLPHYKNKRTEYQNVSIEKNLSENLNVDIHEFMTKCNFFKVSLSKKWDINCRSGFILPRNNSEEKDLNKLTQKEFFDNSILNLSLILGIKYFQQNINNAEKSFISPIEILNNEMKNYVKDYLKNRPSNQWNLVELIKYLKINNSSNLNKKKLYENLNKYFIESSDNEEIRKNRADYLEVLLNVLEN